MDNIYKSYTPPSAGGGSYLKLEDGKPVRVRIMSEPIVFDSTFERGGEVSVSTKYGWAVINLDTKEAQVMHLPGTAYRLIASYGADEDWGDPTGYNLKITRRGTGLDTEYTVVPSAAKEELDEELVNAAKGLDLVGMTEAGRGVNSVQWLRDVVTKGRVKSTATRKDEAVLVDVDEPINLDDIPF